VLGGGFRAVSTIKKPGEPPLEGEYPGLMYYKIIIFVLAHKGENHVVKTVSNGNKCSAVFANWNLIQF